MKVRDSITFLLRYCSVFKISTQLKHC